MTDAAFGPTTAQQRSPRQLRNHYEVEKALAARVRAASREERRHLMQPLYEELFRRVPDHPRLARKRTPQSVARAVAMQERFLRPFLRPDATLLEIGPGDCAFAFAAARLVRQVYGVDVDDSLTRDASPPANFKLFVSDGVSVPVPPASVDIAYSNQLMEHLLPEDARAQLGHIYEAIKPGGVYVCLTPNRLDGPHDASRPFADEAECFHLKEYTVRELDGLFRATGFRRVRAYVHSRNVWLPVPLQLIRAAEAALERLPPAPRRALARRWPLRRLINAALVATK
jgi:SAM-dependent methyltransferase